MNGLRPWHLIMIVVVLILLFGAKRLPDAARSLGRSMRILKAETHGLIGDDNDLAEKADIKHGREPLHPDDFPQTGEYLSPGLRAADRDDAAYDRPDVDPRGHRRPDVSGIDPTKRPNSR